MDYGKNISDFLIIRKLNHNHKSEKQKNRQRVRERVFSAYDC